MTVQKKMVHEIAEYSCFLGIADYKGAPQAIFVKTVKLAVVYKSHKVFCIQEIAAIDLREGQVHNTFSTSLSKVAFSDPSFSQATITSASLRI